MENLAIDHLHGPRGVTEKIRQAMYDAAKQFVYIGFLLWEVKQYKYYEEGGWKDVYQYAEFELGFKRSSTKNFIAIAENFGALNKQGGERLHTMHLQQKYEKFNYSQLVELLGMSEPQRDQTKPDMTVKQLRALKKEPPIIQQLVLGEVISEPEPGQAVSGQTSGQTEPELQACTINNYWKDLPPEVIKAIVKAAGLRWNPKSTYNIKIELHKE